MEYTIDDIKKELRAGNIYNGVVEAGRKLVVDGYDSRKILTALEKGIEEDGFNIQFQMMQVSDPIGAMDAAKLYYDLLIERFSSS
ncbi:MAG: hypothetical protein V1870_01275 [Candidatus Aenigmatarchaeota archaeon]